MPLNIGKPKSYDEHVAVLVEAEVGSKNGTTAIICTDNERRPSQDLLQTFSTAHWIKSKPDHPTLDEGKLFFDGLIIKLRNEIGERVMQALLHGKVRMSVFLDSHGGNLRHAHMIIDAMRYAISNGGTVDTYGLNRIHSAAERMFREGEQRYALPRSTYMWHRSRYADPQKAMQDWCARTGGTPGDYKKNQAEADAREDKEVISFMRSSSDASVRDELEGRFEEAFSGDDPEIRMNSMEMKKFGVAHAIFDTVYALRDRFSRNTGVKISLASSRKRGDPITRLLQQALRREEIPEGHVRVEQWLRDGAIEGRLRGEKP